MYPNNLKVSQGAKILWEGMIRDVSFELGYVLGIDDDWTDAETRGKAITSQMVQDWLEEMACKGKIEAIDPLTFVQTFERGMVQETFHRMPDLIWNRSTEFKDIREMATEAPPKTVKYPTDCLVHKAVQLTFDATGSQERAIRILRAYEEPYTFVHQPNGNWSCIGKERTYWLFVDTQKHLGYCSCQDFQTRGLKNGMPCKHIYAYLLQDGKVKENIRKREEM